MIISLVVAAVVEAINSVVLKTNADVVVIGTAVVVKAPEVAVIISFAELVVINSVVVGTNSVVVLKRSIFGVKAPEVAVIISFVVEAEVVVIIS